MAETTKNRSSGTGAAKRTASARKPATRAAAARKPAAREPAAKARAASKPAARKPAAKSRATSTPAAHRGVVERAALTYVGATLEARDALVSAATGLVGGEGESRRTGSRIDLKRFERRGSTARTHVEREAKRARTRVERELRNRRREAERLVSRNRTRLEREVRTAQRDLTRPRTLVGRQFGRVSHQVESAVHAGVTTGERLVAKARGQFTATA